MCAKGRGGGGTLCFNRSAAIYAVIFLLLGRLSAASPGPAACLGRKDAKRFGKASTPEKRLLILAGIEQRTAGSLWYCLSPWADSWREGGLGPMGPVPKPCSGVPDSLATVDCADQGIEQELAAWAPSGPRSGAALRKTQHILAVAENELGYAEVEAERLTLGLGPIVPNQIKAKRQVLEDLELRITQLLKKSSPAHSSP